MALGKLNGTGTIQALEEIRSQASQANNGFIMKSKCVVREEGSTTKWMSAGCKSGLRYSLFPRASVSQC